MRPSTLRTETHAPNSATFPAEHDKAASPIPTDRVRRAVRGVLEWDAAVLSSIYVAVVLLIPQPFVLTQVGVPPAAAFGLVLGLAWLCGHCAGLPGMCKGRSVGRTAVLVFITALLVIYAHSALVYTAPDELHNSDRTMLLLIAMFGPALFMMDTTSTRDRLDSVLRTLVISGAIVAALGTVQSVTHLDVLGFDVVPGLSVDPAAAAIQGDRGGITRAQSTTGHPIEFGVLCAMLFPLSVHYSLESKWSPRWTQARWWAVTATFPLGSLASVSRSAVIGLAVAMVILSLGWPIRRTLYAIGWLGLLLGVVALVRPSVVQAVYNSFINASDDSSITSRQDDYIAVAAEFARHPWLGRGVGTWYAPVHEILDNQYLLSVVEGGILELLALGVLLATGPALAAKVALRTNDRSTRELALGLCAALVSTIVAAAFYDMLSFATVSSLLVVLLAGVVILSRCTTCPTTGGSAQVGSGTTRAPLVSKPADR